MPLNGTWPVGEGITFFYIPEYEFNQISALRILDPWQHGDVII
jgi:hypothetical protein